VLDAPGSQAYFVITGILTTGFNLFMFSCISSNQLQQKKVIVKESEVIGVLHG
jgi:hypothetical protein